MINSPFNGSNIKMKAKITRKHYEQHPDKYRGFVYDPERGSDYNEFYKVLVNDEGEFLLIREKLD
jgi:hypothetical protein